MLLIVQAYAEEPADHSPGGPLEVQAAVLRGMLAAASSEARLAALLASSDILGQALATAEEVGKAGQQQGMREVCREQDFQLC